MSYTGSRRSSKAEEELCLERLASFDYGDAHCYDPNEEARLRLIIKSLGVDFNNRIRQLAANCKIFKSKTLVSGASPEAMSTSGKSVMKEEVEARQQIPEDVEKSRIALPSRGTYLDVR